MPFFFLLRLRLLDNYFLVQGDSAQLAQLSESSSVQIPFKNRWGYRGKSAPVNSKISEYADLSTFRGASATWRFLTLRSIGEQPMLAVCWNPCIDGVGSFPPQQKRKGLECHHHLLHTNFVSESQLMLWFWNMKPNNHCVKSEYRVICWSTEIVRFPSTLRLLPFRRRLCSNYVYFAK